MKATKPVIIQEWFNIKDCCTYAGVGRVTIKQWMEQGMRYSRSGNRYLFKREHIDSFIESLEVSGKNDGVDLEAIKKKVLAALKEMKA